MISIKTKICGITNTKDALAAVDLGADLLGFIFYPKSPRYIEPGKAMEIIRKIPTFVDTVGVFVNPELDQIRQVNEQGLLNWIQLHGDETPEFCKGLTWMSTRTIKAIRVKDKSDIEKAYEYQTDAILLDTYSKAKYGGTGKAFDWSLIDNLPRRVFLSGGINPGNVTRAIELGLYGIDVSSGIESKPGKKDRKKMKKLFDKIRIATGRKEFV